jgi:hypothetical protein
MLGMADSYTEKLEKENRELVAKLATIHELEYRFEVLTKINVQLQDDLQKQIDCNRNQARMIARLDEQRGVIPYQPLSGLNANIPTYWNKKILEQEYIKKLYEIKDTVFIPSAKKEDLEQIAKQLNYDITNE